MLSRFARLAARMGHARARTLVIACGLLSGLVLGGFVAWVIDDLRSDHFSHSEQDLANLSLTLAEEMDRRLEVLNLLHVGLIEHMRQLGVDSPEAFERQMGSFDAHRDLNRRIAGLPHIAALSLHDGHGNLVNFSRFWPPPPIDVRDRDFIKITQTPAAPKLFISDPVQSKTTGKWTIYFSSRFDAPDGQLIGIVVSSIVADYFEQFFARIVLGGDSAFGLYRNGGTLLVRYPHADPKIGATFGQTENYNRMLSVLDRGAARLVSLLDGKDRMAAGHSVGHYDLIITVSDTIDAILATWRNEARAFGAVTAFLELIIILTVVLAIRHLRSYEMLQAAEAARARAEERERGANALQQQGLRFDTALNNMLQGLLMFDHAGRLLVANRRLCCMFGVPEGALTSGMPYLDVTEIIVAAGQVSAEDMRGVRERRALLIERKERAAAIWEIASGRAFNMTFQPMDDGWLTTFEEVTEQRAAAAKLEHLAQHDALTDLPNRVLFRQRLQDALAGGRRGRMLALLCLDLDQFKAANATTSISH